MVIWVHWHTPAMLALQKLWQKDLEFEARLAYKILSLSLPSQKQLEKTGMLNPTDELHNANVQENITR